MKRQRPKIIHGAELRHVLRERLKGAFEEFKIKACENVEFYLVNLLNELQRTENLFNSGRRGFTEKPLSVIYMEALGSKPSIRIKGLRQVGDTALIVTGFFSENIRAGLVDRSYYTSLGGSAYARLSHEYTNDDQFAEMFREMSAKFQKFAEVLSIVAPWNYARTNTELVRLYERWLTTGSERLRGILDEQGIATGGSPSKGDQP